MKPLFAILPAVAILMVGVAPSEASASARSIRVTLVNNTGHQIILTSTNRSSGGYTVSPPGSLANNTQGSFMIESNGFLTGAIGSCVYRIDGVAGTIDLNYSNPYSGMNHYEPSAPNGYTVTYSGGEGDNAEITFTIAKGAGPNRLRINKAKTR